MITLIYDGACPFCASYIHKQHIEAAFGPVILLDARSHDPRLIPYWQSGYDLDQAMLLDQDGVICTGAEALSKLTYLLATAQKRTLLHYLLAQAPIARSLYPLFAVMRRAALWVKRRKRLYPPSSTEAK